MATTLPPIRGTAQTMIGNFTYEFRNVRPKSFMIPHERLQVGLDPSQADGKAVLITCEELALTTEPFLYTGARRRLLAACSFPVLARFHGLAR